MLAAKLRVKGYNVALVDFPQYDSFFGKEIGAYLSGKGSARADQIDVKSMCLWYAIDRRDKLNSMDLNSFDYIVFDRYTLSNAMYQGVRVPAAERPRLIDWVFELEHGHLAIPVPDFYILLDTPPVISQKLNELKGYREYIGNTGDIYEKNICLQHSVREAYLEISKTMDNMHIIHCVEKDALLPPEVISERIMDIIEL